MLHDYHDHLEAANRQKKPMVFKKPRKIMKSKSFKTTPEKIAKRITKRIATRLKKRLKNNDVIYEPPDTIVIDAISKTFGVELKITKGSFVTTITMEFFDEAKKVASVEIYKDTLEFDDKAHLKKIIAETAKKTAKQIKRLFIRYARDLIKWTEEKDNLNDNILPR